MAGLKQLAALAVLLAGLANGALAQSAITAGQELQRQQERERALREQMEAAPDVRLQAPEKISSEALPEGETPCMIIREVVLKNAAPDFAWAQATVDPAGELAAGRCLGTVGINHIMQRVQDALIARGYVTTRVLAEAQDLNSGILTLTIVPGRIRAIRFTPDSDPRANAWNAMPAAPGDLLNLRDIEQGLENFKRVPTAEADIQIVPGDAPGESDLLITWKQALPLRLTLSANNGGARSTGKELGSVTVSGDHLLALNDLFYASVNRDIGQSRARRGTRGHTLHYSLPYGYWLLSATSSENRYHQTVAGLSQNYLYSGTSENHEIRLSRILHRDGRGKTSASLRGYLNKSANFIDDTEVEVQRRRMAGWELGLQHRAFIADAVLDLAAAYRRGTGAFDALPAPEQNFGEGTARPRILSADASLTIPFRLAGQTFRYLGNWRAQWNRTPLVPQDRFSIGGRYTVRGFDGESILMAERGWLIRNDLGWLIDASGQELYLGLDHGEVGGRSADLLVGKRLTGAVLGLRGGYQTLSWDLFTGWPLVKPDGFQTAANTTGFNLTLSF
ncbi:MAG: ShlB/FhaC/HecB family hemolysin secretion/activation protein [Betaproteobacteria bacterium]|nr:ShlB/FhaC/HecB family hemolysin secretion/activation protein [Betaproteobacteria bacterium]MCL2887578.1 ShlB/FhaC/HecB family hemolysin secretion/activation protein [Betaproteobacteria bacterium]